MRYYLLTRGLNIGRPGVGALAKFADFWYPVRLIQHHEATRALKDRWTVCIWRECAFLPLSGVTAGEWVEVATQNLVDALSNDSDQRRLTRVCVFFSYTVI